MTSQSGGMLKTWFTAAELAALRLPGLSSVKRKVNVMALEQGWALRTNTAGEPLARDRRGRGGGLEYHWTVLPAAAKSALVAQGLTAANDQDEAPRTALWAWFDRETDSVKAEAQRRLAIIDRVLQGEAAGQTRTVAVASAASAGEVSPATVWNWLDMIKGAEPQDRLPRLAPRRQGGGKSAEIHPDALKALISDYLRPEKPTFASCYARLESLAAEQGWGELPHAKTLQRRVEKDVPAQVRILRRNGADALRGTLPPSRRSVAELHALECVNIDGHRWDVFVKGPDGVVFRPTMVAIQDVYSRKILAWRIGETESAVLTRLAFADLMRGYGIPKACWLDNGRAFASKWITGGAANRFRFKVKPEEPLGLLTQLGVEIHWTLPYRGQSKPIERAFRDLCDHVAKDPAFAGAYTGNRPDAKPENYGEKAVDLATFVRVAARGIAAHNARVGRRTEACRGQFSFDQVFEDSYARSPIGQATPEHLRLALLAADRVRADRKSGAVRLFENLYHAGELFDHAGRELVVRFDPDNLHSEVHCYDLDGRFLCTAPVQKAVGFADAEAAKRRARMERTLQRTTREAARSLDLLTAEQLAALAPTEEPEIAPVSPTIVRPVRARGGAAVAVKPRAAGMIDRFPNFGVLGAGPGLRVVSGGKDE